MLDRFGEDTRQAWRSLRRAPGLSGVIVATLGLALAASVATFSVLNAVLVQRLPYRDPDRLVALKPSEKGSPTSCSPPTFVDFRRETRSFAALSATVPWNANLTAAGEPERVRGLRVSADFFEAVGASALLGRTFLSSEEQPGQERVVVVSHGLWRRRFGGEPELLGSAFRLNGQSYTVVGIMPPGFNWGRGWGQEGEGDLWTPLALTPERIAEDQRGNEYLDVYARLRPGLGVSEAQADVDSLLTALNARFPRRYRQAEGFRVTVVPLQEDMVGRFRSGLVLVFCAVASLLLVAASNVAGLLLERASVRRRETSVRAALGASRGQLAGQILCEAGVLAVVSGGAGLAIASAACAALERIDRAALPRSQPIAISWPVAGFALLAVLLVALVSGLVPAWHVARADLMTWLRTGAPGAGGRGTTVARRFLIAAQTAVALALLVATGLLVRSLGELQKIAPGFRASNVLTAQVQLPTSRYEDPARRVAFVDGVVARVSEAPGVRSAAVMSELPLSGASTSGSFFVEGRATPQGDDLPHAELWSASPRYFATLGIGLKRGRLFAEGDVNGRTPVALVNEALVRRYYPDVDPIGRRIDYLTDPQDPQWHEIVGVVGDVRDRRLDDEAQPQIYVPYAQRPEAGVFLVVQALDEPLSALPALRAAVRSQDADLPLYGVTTMQRLVSDNTRDRRAVRTALSFFAAAAVLLAALGLYALLAQVVRERVPEIAVRVALGAGRGDIVRLFLLEGGGVLAWGLCAGVALSVLAARLLRGFVFGVTPTDPTTYCAVGLLLALVAFTASALPAWRASRIDPVRALRSE